MAPSSKVSVADSDPTPPARSAPAAGEHRWGRFLSRVVMVTLRPRAFWRKLGAGAPPAVAELLWPHAILLALLGAAAGLAGDIAKSRAADVVVLHATATFAASVVLMLLFAAVARAVAATESEASWHKALAYSLYGLTPMLVIGVMRVIPVPLVHAIVGLVALPYTFYVLALGVHTQLGVSEARGAVAAGLICAGALLSWSLASALADLPLLP